MCSWFYFPLSLFPGFGVHLVAESNTGCFWAGEAISKPRKGNSGGDDEEGGVDLEAESSGSEISVPEDVGRRAAHNLLEEIYRGGCVDSSAQALAFLFMALGPPDVSKMVVGPLSNYRWETQIQLER